MLKISLKNPPPRTGDRSVSIDTSEAFRVLSHCHSDPHGMEIHQTYLLLVMLAADGRHGPFSAADLYQEGRKGPRLVTDNMPPDVTPEEFERGMHRLIELGVADAAPPDLRLV